MSGNNLTLVAAGAFRDVELSATLDLSDNAQRIASIESHAFAGSEVDKLDLHGSSIGRLETHALSGLVHNDDTLDMKGRGLSFVGLWRALQSDAGERRGVRACRPERQQHRFGRGRRLRHAARRQSRYERQQPGKHRHRRLP